MCQAALVRLRDSSEDGASRDLPPSLELDLSRRARPSVNEAFNKEFYTNYGPRIENIRSVGQRDEGLNQSIERMNNTIRDREKVMRGMDNDDSAQILSDGIRINYNFIRPHMGLDGKTPAQAAGLDLDRIRWKELIRRAISKDK